MLLPQVRICFLGESFVNGTGDPECLGWTGRICIDANKKGYDITYYNLGIRREISTQLKQRWLAEVALRLPKEYDGRLVFSFGVNDTVMENGKIRVDLAESIANARDILSQAQQLYPVLMISPPPVGDETQNQRIANLSRHFAALCQELNVPYLNVFPILENSNIWMNEIKNYDGAHPRAAGYAEFAQIVQNWNAWQNWFPDVETLHVASR
ncbi:MAG: GDSL-type esterase/lipase family protein [Nostocaceae cyanobacterium]|nr:GDSL-type esterase/lipase family protein [Nostocaceae cyanobacterium]